MSRTYQDKAIKQYFKNVRGFALPTILIGSIVMLIVLVGAVTATTATRTALNEQYYDQLAQAAGDAGVAYAKACLNASANTPTWSNASPLMPNTDCSGNPIGGYTCPSATDTRCSVTLNGNIRSSFSVGIPTLDSDGHAVTIPKNGFVDILRTSNSAVWRTYKQQAAQSVVAPGLCSANTTSVLGWGNAAIITAASFPEPTAIPISIASSYVNPGPMYLRKDFSVVKAGVYTLNVRADDTGAVYVDGQLILSSSGGVIDTRTVNLTAGCHNILIKLVNFAILPNPAVITLSLKLNNSSLPLVVSDKSWRVTAGSLVTFSNTNYYADPVAWTPVRDIMAATSTVSAGYWASTTGDSTARYINTTHSYDGSGNYPVGYAVFRDSRIINVAVQTQVKISYACDDFCAIYLDGNIVANGNNSNINSTTLTLSEGNHRFGVDLNNTAGLSGFDLAVVRTSDGAVLSESDTTWTATSSWYATPQNPASYDNTYIPTPNGANASILVVAGGGSGGGSTGGGGGAGGVISTTQTLVAKAYSVVIGAGGAIPGNQAQGITGANSTFNGLIAIGGGGGGFSMSSGASSYGLDGGSGGGGQSYVGGFWASGRGTALQGNTGGPLGMSGSPGGGGAGGSGGTVQVSGSAGYGGPGLVSSISGLPVYYGGGGGGGGNPGGSGGVGGGGAGASSTLGTNGTINTGGGGGGGWAYAGGNGGAGGSGIVIISYPTGTITATGGTITTSGGNTIHTFTSSGLFTVGSPVPIIKVLAVAGGGGGGSGASSAANGGGGGAGGVVYNTGYPVGVQSYPVSVGLGGAANANGSNSVFDTISAVGGGKGGGLTALTGGGNGGSGGGGSSSTTGASSGGAASPAGQGYNGGYSVAGSPYRGGGGGGAGAVGSTSSPGYGGNGVTYSISGISIFYGGGGGAGADAGAGLGGSGGGAAGVIYTSGTGGNNGAANTGGGGGGGASQGVSIPGGAGGSGIVIISYPTGTITATGGTMTTSGGNTIHTFTSNGTFTVNSIP